MTNVAILLPTYLGYILALTACLLLFITHPWTTCRGLVYKPSNAHGVTLTWLAIARTRVSGISVSEAIAATKKEVDKSEEVENEQV